MMKRIILLSIFLITTFLSLVAPVYANPGVGGAGGLAGAPGVSGSSATVSSDGAGGGGGGGSAAGGAGGSGAGGGVFIYGNINLSGTIDARGGGASTTNGGTVKLFYTGTAPSTAGVSAGRTYTVAATAQQSAICVPATVTDDNSVGAAAWSNPQYASDEDNSSATSTTIGGASTVSHYLKLTNCGFSVPSNYTITGIRVDFYRQGPSVGGSSVTDNSVRLLKGGLAQGTDKAGANTWSNLFNWNTYGADGDLWGTTLTPADVNAADFGVAISANNAYNAPAGQGTVASIDATHITVFYSNVAPAAPTLSTPAAGATGVSALPSFQLRSSDPNSDYLQYKIDICSNSDCSSVLRTVDQTASQTGWTGQDAQSNTAYASSSVVSSSTMATYNYQSPVLSKNTQYWWRAYATDPEGSNTWSSASAIQTFTTGDDPPSPPELLYPVSESDGNSVFTTFKLHSTENNSDYLRYKIDVCTDSSCNSILRTIDQTASQTGWSGQDSQTGTAYQGSPTLTTSTIATLNYQPPLLSANTEYWWRGYAIDPGGSNSWSGPSSINSFTTAPTETHIQGNVRLQGNLHFGN